MGALAGKTVLLVTHQVDFLPAFHSVLVSSSFLFSNGSFQVVYSTAMHLCRLIPNVPLISHLIDNLESDGFHSHIR